MGFLSGKRLLITGVLPTVRLPMASPAPAAARAPNWPSATRASASRSASPSSRREFGSQLVFDCDVADDAQIDACSASWAQAWPRFDGFVHAIGFAPREAIAGDFLDGLSRENFRIAHDISAYSFPAMAKAALPRLRPGAALLTLTYLGAVRCVPNYNTMGLAKAVAGGQRALPGAEPGRRRACASTASRPARSGRWRRRASRTSASCSTSSRPTHPLRRNVTIDDVGNVAAFLLSRPGGRRHARRSPMSTAASARTRRGER